MKAIIHIGQSRAGPDVELLAGKLAAGVDLTTLRRKCMICPNPERTRTANPQTKTRPQRPVN